MGGYSTEEEVDYDSEFSTSPPSSPLPARTLVLVGRTGNGKSATGNTILGREVFQSKLSPSGVTSSCELQSTDHVIEDGRRQILHVIDTPGLFDDSMGHDRMIEEVAKCISMAQNGIHAVILVFSVRNRCTKEEVATIRSLEWLFGSQIFDYMIVVFTGGDELKKGTTLDEYLGSTVHLSPAMKDVLCLCKNRKVLFDNNTEDEMKRAAQVKELMAMVNSVVEENGGHPYMDDIFVEMQKRNRTHDKGAAEGASDDPEMVNFLKRIDKMVKEGMKETTQRLEEKIRDEEAARLKAEEAAKNEIRILRDELERSRKEAEDLRNRPPEKVCTIL